MAGVGTLVASNPVQAQDPGTGTSAFKNCPGATAQPGQTITCNFAVANTGDFPAEVTLLTETSPEGSTAVDITCTAGGVAINEGDTLPQDVPCTGTFQVTIANNPALCGTNVVDRVDIELLYTTGFPEPLTAGAFATHITRIVCPPADITVTKMADALSKLGDSVTYTIEVCNAGLATVNRVSVIDTLLGNISASFAATLAPGACSRVVRERTVAAGDLDPLVNTVTATYSAVGSSDTATASASTNLFQPSVDVTKSCSPDPIQVGQNELCTITVRNTSSTDTPLLINGTITDTLTGNLLLAGNPAVVNSTCGTTLANGATCVINTTRTVLSSDPSPLVNTVTVNYNPTGFPNNIRDTADGFGDHPARRRRRLHPRFLEAAPALRLVGRVPDDATVRHRVRRRRDPDGRRRPSDQPDAAASPPAQGGGVNALARHAVAALLNASSPDVDSDFTVAQVIAIVQSGVNPGRADH